MKTERRKYGDQRACSRCQQDIEWHGREHGWIDRGSGQECLPYIVAGEVMSPKGKHTIRARA